MSPKEIATEISIQLFSSWMVNNPDICIKDMGSTFACVCKECMGNFNKAKELYD